ncbi:MerR family transcriptional regulator [Sphingomonas jatrophae]|uniref:DNA-binding transcriptional regulator, MerR family n=1 Tax=Sphingomonas jatrophae TaxID=1166337 RepID=A0A1I6M667_9SPHN|nr:MerR family transcriptional regulator [Sphingomonas jatrophae]SFS11194.1 DNA-binding transcriptional regulator, MerR family [Sphingomonas jatrophae]
MTAKADGAFLTISELSTELGVPQHVLRYWETKFPQLKPLTRAGNRRYYRPSDVALARRIHTLLNLDGYTIRGVQQLLEAPVAATPPAATPLEPPIDSRVRDELAAIRALLARALAE